MSRRVVIVIGIIIVLSILLAIGLFFVTSLNKEQAAQPTPDATTSNAGLTSSTTVDPLADPDNDNLNNAQEALWGTNPNNPDTDGDGYKDGEEVANCHNPLVPAPKDKLVNCTPGQNSESTTSTATTGTSDLFFPNPPAKIAGDVNLTQAYATAVKDSDKSPVTFSQFIANQPINTDLPAINEKAITTQKDSQLALAQYMSIAGDINTITDKTRFQLAINALLTNSDSSQFATFAQKVLIYQHSVESLSVPTSALEYHKLILAYSELLTSTFSQISNYSKDQVKALSALRQLDAIDRQYYPQITQLRAKLLSQSQTPTQ
jgi:hypothetical protein